MQELVIFQKKMQELVFNYLSISNCGHHVSSALLLLLTAEIRRHDTHECITDLLRDEEKCNASQQTEHNGQ